MNTPLILIGSVISVLILLFAVISLADGVKTAAIVIALTVALVGALSLVLAFWFWVGGAFA